MSTGIPAKDMHKIDTVLGDSSTIIGGFIIRGDTCFLDTFSSKFLSEFSSKSHHSCVTDMDDAKYIDDTYMELMKEEGPNNNKLHCKFSLVKEDQITRCHKVRSVNTRRKLRGHLKKDHLPIDVPRCEECMLHFSTYEDWVVHHDTCHDETVIADPMHAVSQLNTQKAEKEARRLEIAKLKVALSLSAKNTSKRFKREEEEEVEGMQEAENRS